MIMEHFIVKCDKCDKVIVQCRCVDKNKKISYETCTDCSGVNDKINEALTPLPPKMGRESNKSK